MDVLFAIDDALKVLRAAAMVDGRAGAYQAHDALIDAREEIAGLLETANKMASAAEVVFPTIGGYSEESVTFKRLADLRAALAGCGVIQ